MRTRWQRFPGLTARILGIALLTGCSSWQVQPEPADAVIAQQHPGTARFTTEDGTQIVLREPTVSAGLITGNQTHISDWGEPRPEPYSIPAASVARVEFWKVDPARTVAGMTLFSLGLVAVCGVGLALSGPLY
jgi:hypothetical protein